MSNNLAKEFTLDTGISLFKPKGGKKEFVNLEDIFYTVFASLPEAGSEGSDFATKSVAKSRTSEKQADCDGEAGSEPVHLKTKSVFKSEVITAALEKRAYRFVQDNLLDVKVEDGSPYFIEGQNFIKTDIVTGKKGRRKIVYWVDVETAQMIVARSDTTIGRTVLRKLIAYTQNRFKFQHDRQDAAFFYKGMCQAVAVSHDPVQYYHFSNEADMINRIVIGMTAKEYKLQYGVDNIREHMSLAQISQIAELEKINCGLILIGKDFAERKKSLKEHFDRKYAPKQIVVSNDKQIAS